MEEKSIWSCTEEIVRVSAREAYREFNIYSLSGLDSDDIVIDIRAFWAARSKTRQKNQW